jgi:hypothetical protein
MHGPALLLVLYVRGRTHRVRHCLVLGTLLEAGTIPWDTNRDVQGSLPPRLIASCYNGSYIEYHSNSWGGDEPLVEQPPSVYVYEMPRFSSACIKIIMAVLLVGPAPQDSTCN